MPFVSQLIGRSVVDIDGDRIGNLEDLIVIHQPGSPRPQISALVIKRSGKPVKIAFSDVLTLFTPAISLNRKAEFITYYQSSANEICLNRDVMDKQIIDVNGARVVRVNDLELGRINDQIFLTNVDISGWGILRRLGLSGFLQRFQKGPKIAGQSIAWGDIDLPSIDQPLQLKVTSEKIKELHPADLADLLTDLSRSESTNLLERLDVETVAETLEEVEPEFQASLIEQMEDERAADVLEEMSPDEAADLLAELPEDRSEELLKLMESDEAADVRKLLTYPEESAGGIMTTEFTSISSQMNAGQIISFLRDSPPDVEALYYIYVTDPDQRLEGVFTLRELVLARPDTPVSEFMERRIVAVSLLEAQDHVAEMITKYNLLAIPVVDEDKHLHGIVTADDALDKIIPTAWKKRLPRLYH